MRFGITVGVAAFQDQEVSPYEFDVVLVEKRTPGRSVVEQGLPAVDVFPLHDDPIGTLPASQMTCIQAVQGGSVRGVRLKYGAWAPAPAVGRHNIQLERDVVDGP